MIKLREIVLLALMGGFALHWLVDTQFPTTTDHEPPVSSHSALAPVVRAPSPSPPPSPPPALPPPPARMPLDCRPPRTDDLPSLPRAPPIGTWEVPPVQLFNPLPGQPPLVHDPVIRQFRQFVGGMERDSMLDWLGIRTAFHAECTPDQPYNYVDYVPSRFHQCMNHCTAWNAGNESLRGEMPLLDDEYPEYLDLLSSVLRTRDDYVIFELGARFATWAVRGMAAWRQLRGRDKKSFMVALEPDGGYFRTMTHHVAANGFTKRSFLVQGVAKRSASYSIEELALAANVTHISFLDVDIQGAEFGLFLKNPATMAFLNKVCDHVHIGTHQEDHSSLVALFTRAGWIPTVNYKRGTRSECEPPIKNGKLVLQPQCLTETLHGRAYVRDGMVAFLNPRRVDMITISA